MINLILWIIFGIVAGAIAKAIVPGHQGGGIVATSILGIIGSLLGGTLYSFISGRGLQLTTTGNNPFDLASLVVAVIGAIIAIFLYGLLTNRR
jgi:uncharacterized membrane protein YeaQ/YmgE (transglycosylase-associated protein family)